MQPVKIRSLTVSLLVRLMPLAERAEVAADVDAEYAERRERAGAMAAYAWLLMQFVRSIPPLLRRTWWRGFTGFDAHANAMQPGGPLLERWIIDARYAARRLRNRPTYAALSVLTLALGVGGMAAISSIARAVLVDPLPYRNSGELAAFWDEGGWQAREVLAMRGQWLGFTSVAAYRPQDVTIQFGASPTRSVFGIASSSELFDVLGVAPAMGRGFSRGEDVVGAAPIAILSHQLWTELGEDPGIIGKRVTLDGVSRTVIGVMPAGFWFPDPTVRVWIADALNPTETFGQYSLVGRAGPGQDLRNMRHSLGAATTLLASQFKYSSQWDKTRNAAITPLRETLVAGTRPALYATLAAVAAILLIACANIGALMLGQVESRGAELALRTALGADRGRLVSQLIAEGLAIGLLGGLAGSVVAIAGFNVLRGALPLGSWTERATLDWSVFAISMVFAIACSLAVSMLPAMSVWRSDLRFTLGGSRTGGVLNRNGLQGAMVVSEVALAVLLACGAGLLVRSVQKLYAIVPGIETRGIAVVDIATPANMKVRDRRQMLANVVRELSALPGVKSVAMTQKVPLRGQGWTSSLSMADVPKDAPAPYFHLITPGYFATFGIALRDGRLFDGSELPTDTIPSVIVNEALAKIYFPKISPIGQVIRGSFSGSERIVGVVADAASAGLTDGMVPARYYRFDQVGFVPQRQSFVVRAERAVDVATILDQSRAVVARLAPDAAIQQATTMQRVFDTAVGPARDVMTLLALLTGLALLLSAIGIYGVIAQFVGRRTRDWSIRMALGLEPWRVVRFVVAHAAALVAGGIVVGVAVAVVAARALSSLLYGVAPSDPVSLAIAALALLAVGVVAALIPAVRASRTDAALVLRGD